MITVPASSVVPRESSETMRATEWIINDVEESCMTTPFTRVTMRSACGSGTAEAGVTALIGQKVSKPLPRQNCPPPPSRCHQRAVTSFAAAYPPITVNASASGTSLHVRPMMTASSPSKSTCGPCSSQMAGMTIASPSAQKDAGFFMNITNASGALPPISATWSV